MKNAVDMLAKAYMNDNYKGHGVTVHKVPKDTVSTGFDAYPPANAAHEREALANPKANMDANLGAEFQLLMGHFRSSLYRVEFAKCKDPACSLCARDPIESSPLTDLLDRFPRGMLPTPVPVLRDDGLYPVLSTLMRSSEEAEAEGHRQCRDRDGEGQEAGASDFPNIGDFARVNTGRYRTLYELAKTNLPGRCFFSDSHYYGKTQKFQCLTCNSFVVAKSEAALKRHKRLVHQWAFDG